jgi:transposase-like protein
MDYSEAFKRRMIKRLVGPDAISASALSRETGTAQSTLSRWLRQATTMNLMPQDENSPKDPAAVLQRRPQDWTAEQRLRAVMETASMTDAELGAYLRQEGLHEEQLSRWREAALQAVSGKPASRRKRTAEARRMRQMERELRRKDKALAEAAALLVLQKKVRELWGDEDDDT